MNKAKGARTQQEEASVNEENTLVGFEEILNQINTTQPKEKKVIGKTLNKNVSEFFYDDFKRHSDKYMDVRLKNDGGDTIRIYIQIESTCPNSVYVGVEYSKQGATTQVYLIGYPSAGVENCNLNLLAYPWPTASGVWTCKTDRTYVGGGGTTEYYYDPIEERDWPVFEGEFELDETYSNIFGDCPNTIKAVVDN